MLGKRSLYFKVPRLEGRGFLCDFLALFSDFEVVFQKGSKKRVTVALKNKNLAA